MGDLAIVVIFVDMRLLLWCECGRMSNGAWTAVNSSVILELRKEEEGEGRGRKEQG